MSEADKMNERKSEGSEQQGEEASQQTNISKDPQQLEPGDETENANAEIIEGNRAKDAQSTNVLTGPAGNLNETENMEVHHHGHVHEKKKWKEYLFQFFMLFLAVFCGFLAEYQLEHVVEHNREKQYIKSFIQDLKSDTAKINKVIQTTTGWQNKMFDSLMGVIKQKDFFQYPEKAHKYFPSVFSLNLFYHTDRTMQQLKNSGGLRLIRKQSVSDSIMQYDNMVKKIAEQAQDVYNCNQTAIRLSLQIFDANASDNEMINRNLVPRADKIKLISNDIYKVDELFNWLMNFKLTSIIYCEMLNELKQYASRQIIFLNKSL